MTIFIWIFAGFLVLYIGMTFYASRNVKTKDQFYVMNGNANAWLVAGTYTATWISAVGMVGQAGRSYTDGPLTGMWSWGAIIGYIISAFFIGNKLRRFGQVTMSDFYGARFDSDTIRLLTAVVTILGLFAYFAAGIIGSAIIAETLFGLPYNAMVALMAAVFIVIAVVGGVKSVTITDTIMLAGIVVLLALIFSPVLLNQVGVSGFAAEAAANPVRYTGGGGVYSWGVIIGWQFIWGFGNAANPAALTRCLIAKDERTWVKSMILSTIFTFFIAWTTHMASAAVHIINPNLAGGQALTWAAMNLVHPAIGALAIAGLYGACLSTASTQVFTLALNVSRDIYEQFILKRSGRSVDDRRLIKLTRICIVVFGTLGAMLALGNSTLIVDIGSFGSSIFASAFFFPLFLGMTWRRFSRRAAVWSLVCGLAVDTLLYAVVPAMLGLPMQSTSFLPFELHPTIYAFIASGIAAVVGGFLFDSNDKEKAVFDLCNKPVAAGAIRTSLKSVYGYVWALVVYAVLQTAVILWFAAQIG